MLAIETTERIRQLQDGNKVLNEQLCEVTTTGQEWHHEAQVLGAKVAELEVAMEKKTGEHAFRESKLESQVQALNDELSPKEARSEERYQKLKASLEDKEKELADLKSQDKELRLCNLELDFEVNSLKERLQIAQREAKKERELLEEEFDKRKELIVVEARRDFLREMSERAVDIQAELADATIIVRAVRKELGLDPSSFDEFD